MSWNLGQIPQAPLLQLFTGANPPVSKAGLLISLEHFAEVDRKSPINYLGCSFFTGNCMRKHPVLAEGFDAWCQFCSEPSQGEGSSCGTNPGGFCCSCACLEPNLPLETAGPVLQPVPSATDAPAVTILKQQRPAPILYQFGTCQE